jgi:hypothetical protein
MGVFFGDTAGWWVKDFGLTVTQSHIQLDSTVIMEYYNSNGICMRKDDKQSC